MDDKEIINKSKFGSTNHFISDSGKIIYLYRIDNLVNGKIYIGVRSYKGVNAKKDRYIGNGMSLKKNGDIEYSKDSPTTHLSRSYMKYGLSNFNKKILLYYNSLKEALDDERIIVDDKFIKSKYSMNMIIGGGAPPTGSGKLNNNFGKFWTDKQKLHLSNKLKSIGHAKGGKNVKAKKCVLFDLFEDKQYEIECMKDVSSLFPEIKDITPLNYISRYRFYFLPVEFRGMGVSDAIEKFGLPNTKRTYKLINLYKSGVTTLEGLSEFSESRKANIGSFLKSINNEIKSNNY